MPPQTSDAGAQWEKEKPRRRFIRYCTDLHLSVLDSLERNFDGRCNVISEGGLGGTVVGQLRLGSVVRLQFSIPTYPVPFNVLAVVRVNALAVARHQREFQHGFEFVSLTDPEKDAIQRFCKRLRIN